MIAWHHLPNGQELEKTPEDNKKAGKPGLLQFMGPQRVGHDFLIEKQDSGYEFWVFLSVSHPDAHSVDLPVSDDTKFGYLLKVVSLSSQKSYYLVYHD